MRINVRVLASVFVVLALAVCLLSFTGPGFADGEKEAAAAVQKLADALEKGDKPGIDAATADLKKMELLPIMIGFKRRDATPPGIGFGAPKTVPENEDGIEAKIMSLGRREMPQPLLQKQAGDIKKAAYIAAAIAEVAASKCPTPKKIVLKNGTVQDPKDWDKWMQDMKDGAKALAEAAKKGDKADPAEIKAAASKLNTSCNSCHGPFRDNTND